MSILEWKKFNFYQLTQYVGSQKYQNIKADITSHCYCGRRQVKVFCDKNGWIHVFYKNWESISFYSNQNAIELCAITDDSNILATLRQERAQVIIQLFNLQKITKRNGGTPSCSFARLPISYNATVLRACMIDTQCCIAVGFESGEIAISRSGLSRDISSNFRVFGVSSQKVTGIEFIVREPSVLDMFVCSDAGVFCFAFDGNVSDSRTVLDNTLAPSRSCTVHTNAFDDSGACFIVGRDDAVYCFNREGRGPCYAIDGRKKIMVQFGTSLIIVMDTQKQGSDSELKSTLIVIDIINKLIVLNRIVQPIAGVIVENANCYILTTQKQVLSLRECDLGSKVRALLNKNLFDIALRLIEPETNDYFYGYINLKYGDYLLSRGDLDNAIDKYVKTAGIIESYCVIKKLLDTRYNNYLVIYLNSLIKKNIATPEHIHLLQMCNKRLDMIVPQKQDRLGNISDYKSIPMLCEQSYNLTEFFNALNEPKEGIQFFLQLKESDLLSLLYDHQDILTTHYPEQILSILKLICNNYKQETSSKNVQQYAENLIPLLLKNNNCINFLEYVVKNVKSLSNSIYNLLLDLYLREWNISKKSTDDVILFLSDNIDHLNVNDVLLLCRNYGFWSGILFIYENVMKRVFYLKGLTNTMNTKNVLSIEYLNDLNANLWVQFLNEEKTEQLSNIVQQYFNIKFSNGNKSIFKNLQILTGNKNITVGHIKNYLNRKQLRNSSDRNHYDELVSNYTSNLDILTNRLLNFFKYPIEYRCSACWICKQELKLPVTYFLCQHSYHRECLNEYSQSRQCVICINTNTIAKQSGTSVTGNQISSEDKLIDNWSSNVMEKLSLVLAEGVCSSSSFKNFENNCITKKNEGMLHDNLTISDVNQEIKVLDIDSHKTIKKGLSTNPFENEGPTLGKNPFLTYDDNLNPFE